MAGRREPKNLAAPNRQPRANPHLICDGAEHLRWPETPATRPPQN